MIEKFLVDQDGEVLVDGAPLNVNVFQHTGAMLMSGRYERSGFGMTAVEKEAATYLGLFNE